MTPQTFYGTHEETYYVNKQGRVWVVQSPDIPAGMLAVTCESLPEGARRLDDNSATVGMYKHDVAIYLDGADGPCAAMWEYEWW